MSLPADVREAVQAALGDAARIRSVAPVGGGSINQGGRIDTVGGGRYFLKWNWKAPVRMFVAESEGLEALRNAAGACGAGLRIPRPVTHGRTAGASWLLMEYVDRGPEDAAAEERLGRELAVLHDVSAGDAFGWPASNWIGSLPQDNAPSRSWSEFWRDRRLRPQLELAREGGRLYDGLFDRILELTPVAVEGVETPALLHGDLWSGNAWSDREGRPVLVDPAVYRGDPEVDLAMTQLFGGFGEPFRRAYHAVRPASAAYRSHRRALYQLYYLLVHVNLFGGSYVASARQAAEEVVAALT